MKTPNQKSTPNFLGSLISGPGQNDYHQEYNKSEDNKIDPVYNVVLSQYRLD